MLKLSQTKHISQIDRRKRAVHCWTDDRLFSSKKVSCFPPSSFSILATPSRSPRLLDHREKGGSLLISIHNSCASTLFLGRRVHWQGSLYEYTTVSINLVPFYFRAGDKTRSAPPSVPSSHQIRIHAGIRVLEDSVRQRHRRQRGVGRNRRPISRNCPTQPLLSSHARPLGSKCAAAVLSFCPSTIRHTYMHTYLLPTHRDRQLPVPSCRIARLPS